MELRLSEKDTHGRLGRRKDNEWLARATRRRRTGSRNLRAGQLQEYRNMHKEWRFGELPEMCRECKDWQSAYAEFFVQPTADAAGVA